MGRINKRKGTRTRKRARRKTVQEEMEMKTEET